MRLKSHIKIASKTFDCIKSNNTLKINKTAYLIGSIAPDLNVALPKHCINYTIKRWRRRVKRIDKLYPKIIKSFTLGVIMHYTCDYFCYVHNIPSHGPKHIIYERGLNKYLLDNVDEIEADDYLNSQWNKIRDTLEKSLDCSISIITEQLLSMNRLYMQEVDKIITGIWHVDTNIMSIDMKYAEFMCRKIAIELVCI